MLDYLYSGISYFALTDYYKFLNSEYLGEVLTALDLILQEFESCGKHRSNLYIFFFALCPRKPE